MPPSAGSRTAARALPRARPASLRPPQRASRRWCRHQDRDARTLTPRRSSSRSSWQSLATGLHACRLVPLPPGAAKSRVRRTLLTPSECATLRPALAKACAVTALDKQGSNSPTYDLSSRPLQLTFDDARACRYRLHNGPYLREKRGTKNGTSRRYRAKGSPYAARSRRSSCRDPRTT